MAYRKYVWLQMQPFHHLRNVLTILVLVPLASLTLSGCSTVNQYDHLQTTEIRRPADSVPSSPRTDSSGRYPPRLAIAFGGGAARGMMHLGVMKALEEEGIKADIVTGTSVGAIAAALYSANDYSAVHRLLFQFAEHDITDVNLSPEGVLKGKALAKWVNKHVAYDDIRKLPMPTGIVATNLTRQKPVVFTAGDVGQAVQTSASVPGVFVPVNHHGDVLVDGGVLSVVPVYAARQLGADVVIAVDVFCSQPPPLGEKAVDTMANTFWLQSCQLASDEIASADMVITPIPPDNSLVNFGRTPEREAAVDAGYLAMKQQIGVLKQLLSQADKKNKKTS